MQLSTVFEYPVCRHFIVNTHRKKLIDFFFVFCLLAVDRYTSTRIFYIPNFCFFQPYVGTQAAVYHRIHSVLHRSKLYRNRQSTSKKKKKRRIIEEITKK